MESDNECAVVVVVVCNEDMVDAVDFKWKWEEDELPTVDQYTYLGVEISKDCSWDAHIATVVGKGKSQVCRVDWILTYSYLDTRIKICILINEDGDGISNLFLCNIWNEA